MSFIPESTSPTSDIKQVSSSPSKMTTPLPPTDASGTSDTSPEATVKPSIPHVTTSVSSSPSSTSPASPPMVASPISTSHVQVNDTKKHANLRGRRQDSSGTSSSSGTAATSTSGRTQTSQKGNTFSVSTVSDSIRNILHEIGEMLAKLMKSYTAQPEKDTVTARPKMHIRSKSLSMSFKQFVPASSSKTTQASAPTANPVTPVHS